MGPWTGARSPPSFNRYFPSRPRLAGCVQFHYMVTRLRRSGTGQPQRGGEGGEQSTDVTVDTAERTREPRYPGAAAHTRQAPERPGKASSLRRRCHTDELVKLGRQIDATSKVQCCWRPWAASVSSVGWVWAGCSDFQTLRLIRWTARHHPAHTWPATVCRNSHEFGAVPRACIAHVPG